MKVAVIGLGAGSGHLRNYAAIDGVELVAIADLDAERSALLAAEYGIKHSFRDYNELLVLPAIELVSVCLPNYLHAPVAIAALEAGKHVLIEKPMALNAAEAERIVAAAQQAGRSVAVAMNYRSAHAPDTYYLKQRINEGLLGEIYFVRAQALRRQTFPPGYRGPRDWFIDRSRSGGGGLIDMGPHMLDLAMWLSGDYRPLRVSGQVHTALMTDTDIDDLATALIQMSGGGTVAIEITWASFTRPGASIVVYGTRGGAILDLGAAAGQRLTLFEEANGEQIEAMPTGIEAPAGSDRSIQEHVVRCLRAGIEPDTAGWHGLAVMQVIDAVYESSRAQHEVVLAQRAGA